MADHQQAEAGTAAPSGADRLPWTPLQVAFILALSNQLPDNQVAEYYNSRLQGRQHITTSQVSFLRSEFDAQVSYLRRQLEGNLCYRNALNGNKYLVDPEANSSVPGRSLSSRLVAEAVAANQQLWDQQAADEQFHAHARSNNPVPRESWNALQVAEAAVANARADAARNQQRQNNHQAPSASSGLDAGQARPQPADKNMWAHYSKRTA
ncbi:hypothetical protein GE09DRAFT_1231268 [Coniochaeta sp. 2T2.1]|nr:hypothetical protein GE09DRAFT_1231268 [Coniochaeta sp. 2T2.1]